MLLPKRPFPEGRLIGTVWKPVYFQSLRLVSLFFLPPSPEFSETYSFPELLSNPVDLFHSIIDFMFWSGYLTKNKTQNHHCIKKERKALALYVLILFLPKKYFPVSCIIAKPKPVRLSSFNSPIIWNHLGREPLMPSRNGDINAAWSRSRPLIWA